MRIDLPYTYKKIILNTIDKKGKTVLDVGCGDGELMKYVNRDKIFDVTGIDGHEPFVKKAQRTQAYSKLLKKNVINLNFPSKSFDIVICSQVIMYLSKKDAENLIKKMEDIAKRQVIIGVPQGDIHHRKAQHNPLQTSYSAWSVRDLEKMKYTVYGQGFRLVYREKGYKKKKVSVFRVIPMGISYALSPIIYRKPVLATHLVASKRIRK